MATVVHDPLPLPDPPEGEGPWKYALVGQALAESIEGKELIERMEKQGILVEVLTGGGYSMQTMVQVPQKARFRAFRPDEGIHKP